MGMFIVRTERGWAGHFICSNRCRFHRNTLLEYGSVKIVVSTVGLLEREFGGSDKFDKVGCDRYFETMVFHADQEDTRYYDADVSKEISIKSPWCINEIDADDRANEMHEAVVIELTNRIHAGEFS